jgi:ABC-2 type transport system permease protein
LLAATTLIDPAAARQQVDENQVVAAVIIPAGFTRSILPAADGSTGPQADIEIYTNPSSPTSASIIQTIVEGFTGRVEVAKVGGQVAVTQMIQQGLIQPQEAARIGQQIGSAQAASGDAPAAITIQTSTNSGADTTFDALAYMAPGLALMFLMYTASNGGRSLLTERNQGTLPRLMAAPLNPQQILGGKVFGVYLTGVAQMLILIGASSLLFRLQWGDLWGVLALVLAAVAGAVGWGMLITSVAKTPGQVANVGSAIMLTFGILGGTFIDRSAMPTWVQTLSKITPNAWGVDGFTTLALGGGLTDVLLPVIALLVMAVILFAIAAVMMSRRSILAES